MKQAVLIRKIRKYVTAITIVISVMTMAGCESEDEEYVGWLPNQEGWCEGPKMDGLPTQHLKIILVDKFIYLLAILLYSH